MCMSYHGTGAKDRDRGMATSVADELYETHLVISEAESYAKFRRQILGKVSPLTLLEDRDFWKATSSGGVSSCECFAVDFFKEVSLFRKRAVWVKLSLVKASP